MSSLCALSGQVAPPKAARGDWGCRNTTATVGTASLARGLILLGRLQRHVVAIGDIRVVGHCKPEAQLWYQSAHFYSRRIGGATIKKLVSRLFQDIFFIEGYPEFIKYMLDFLLKGNVLMMFILMLYVSPDCIYLRRRV